MGSKIYKTFKDAAEVARKHGHSLVRNGDGWEVKLTNTNVELNKDLDTTQELQRKQAQAILDLKKGKRR